MITTRRLLLPLLLLAALVAPMNASAAPRFTDVPTNHAFTTQIAWLADQGISTGYSDGTFRPGQPVLREQMAAFMYRFAGSPPHAGVHAGFSDVAANHAFKTHISWMSGTRITTGYVEGHGGVGFRPAEPVLREQMAAFLWRLAGKPPVQDLPAVSPFPDVPTGHLFYEAIVWLSRSGITTGYSDKTFRGSEPVLREQMAAFLFRFEDLLDRKASSDTELVSQSPDGAPHRQRAETSDVSADGRYVVYQSNVPSDTGEYGWADLVRWADRETGEISQAPQTVTSGPYRGRFYDATLSPQVSDDGRFVLLHGRYEDWASGSLLLDTVLWDLETDTLTLVGARAANGSLSADGRYVALVRAVDPTTGTALTEDQASVWDRVTGVDIGAPLATPSGFEGVGSVAISPNGRYVAFAAWHYIYGGQFRDMQSRIHVWDREAPDGSAVRPVSRPLADGAVNRDTLPGVADDGTVIYESRAPDMTIGDSSRNPDVKLWDPTTGVTTLVSRGPSGLSGDGYSVEASISADGGQVAFVSSALDLVPGHGEFYEVFLWERATESFTVISKSYWGGRSDTYATKPMISGDGDTVVYSSSATNLVPFELFGYTDIYAWDRPE